MRTNRIFKFLLSIITLTISNVSLSQLDDLTIVEYVDTEAPYNDGYGVKIYNPTGSTIDLSDYYFKLYHNGNTNATIIEQLSGTLSPGSIYIVGNDDYCSMCPSDCDYEMIAVQGVNENDVVAISKSNSNNTFIDMVGPYDANVNSKVADTPLALLHHKLLRECNNEIRYVNAASASGPSGNSWYSNASTSMPGWVVDTISCLTRSEWNSEIEINISSTTICKGDSVFLDASSYNGDSVLWIWSSDSSIQESFYASDSGWYYLDVFATCPGNDSFYITVLEGEDIVDLGLDDTVVCVGDTLEYSLSTFSYDSVLWSWSGGSSDSIDLVVSDSGIYTVQLFHGCGGKDTFEVYMVEVPDYMFDILDDTLCEDSVYIRSLSMLDAEYFTWVGGSVNITSDTFVTTKAGTYVVTAWYSCGSKKTEIDNDTFSIVFEECDDPADSVEILPFSVPNIITPNGDGVNDKFTVSGMNGDNYILQVFNRWGNLIYEDQDYQNEWSPSAIPDGTYYYKLMIPEASNNPDVSPDYRLVLGYFQVSK